MTQFFKKWSLSLLTAFCLMIAFIYISKSDMGDYVEAHFSSAFQYKARNYFGKYPKLSPKVKILVFDDVFISYLNRTDLTAEEWYKILASINKKKPRRIYIDKIFGYVPDKDIPAIKKLEELKAPVVVGGMGVEHQIKDKISLLKSKDDHKALTFYPLNQENETKHKNIYGPHPLIRSAFDNVGHIVYEGIGFYKPYYRYSKTHVFPHSSFYTDPNAKMLNDSLTSGGTTVKFDKNGRLPYNFGPTSYYQRKSYSIKAAYQEAVLLNRASSLVEEDDVVVILPLMFTGNTDWIPTPLGKIPGGFLLAASYQSMLSGEFLHKMDSLAIPFILIFGVLGIFLGIYLGFAGFWWSQIVIISLTVFLGFYAFIYHSLMLPWIYGILSIFICGLIFNIKKTFLDSLIKQRMQQELATAKIVQRYFFNHSEIKSKKLQGETLYSSAYECSGDWWYFKSFENIDYILIGDVMGHGTSAALVTAIIHSNIVSQFQTLENTPRNPKEILLKLNHILYEILQGKVSTSMLAIAIDHSKEQILIANAGHNFPFLLNLNTKKVKGFPIKGSVLGVSEDPIINEKQTPYLPNLRIFAYTDGLIENSDLKLKNMTRLKLKKILEKNVDNNCKEMNQSLLAAAKEAHKSLFNEDDITLISIETKANQS